MKALVDASSLLLLLKHVDGRRLAEIAGDLSTIDMAVYEASNGIWKQASLFKQFTTDDALEVHNALLRLASQLSVVRWDELGHREAMETAIKGRIAYYDAYYLVAANRLGLPLVTDDRRLAAASSGQKVIGWRELAREI